MAVAIDSTIIVIIVWYAILVGGSIMLILYRTNRRIQLRQYPTPHTPIGEDAYQVMKDEISVQLGRVSQIKIQPRFLTVEGQHTGESVNDDLSHRMTAVDSMRSLDRMIKEILPAWQKEKQLSVREFLYILSRAEAPLSQCPDLCAALLDSYERARYGGQPYNENEKKVFLDMLMDVINRLSILNPEDYANGPVSTDIDKEGILKWLQAPDLTPDFPRRSLNKSNSGVHRKSDAYSESRDLIDLSLSEADLSEHLTGTIERPASLEILEQSGSRYNLQSSS